MSDAERLAAALARLERNIARARRLMRAQAFLIGALVGALILAYLR